MPGCPAPVRGSRSLSRVKRNPGERLYKSTIRPNQQNRPAHNPQLVSAAVDSDVLTLTFDRTVMVRGLTGVQTDIGATELAAVRGTDPNTVEITYDASVAAATEVIFPPYTGMIRSRDGGFAVIPTFPVAA